MRLRSISSACLVGVCFAVSGCVPVPTSTVPLQHRETCPVAAQSEKAENGGDFSAVVFDRSGSLVAAYDSGSDRVRIFRASDLREINSLKPARRPRRLSFSPTGRFLVIEAQAGWIEEHLEGRPSGAKSDSSHVSIDSPEAVRDNIQRVEIWELSTGRTVNDLACDDSETSDPQGGWLWAKNWAIVPGYRTAPIIGSHFSQDESEFSILCWNGVRQRWDTRTWSRRDNLPAPEFWSGLMNHMPAMLLADEGVSCVSADGRVVAFRVRERAFGFGTAFTWDLNSGLAQRIPGDAPVHALPVSGLSADGKRLATICGKGLGHSIRVWDLGVGREMKLENADFNLGRGGAEIRSQGVALSSDGHYLAASLLAQSEALVVTPLPGVAGFLTRSDLRVWNVDEGRELVSVPIDDVVGEANYFHGVDLAFSPDGSLLALAGRQIRIYRMSDLGGR